MKDVTLLSVQPEAQIPEGIGGNGMHAGPDNRLYNHKYDGFKKM
jgi:hypothetical protein